MRKRVLIPLAEGCEEIEAVTIIDILRRAGIDVVVAGLDSNPVRASRGTVIVPDAALDEALAGNFDMVALPGGMPGMENLAADGRIVRILREMAAAGKYTAAICASPVILARAGLLDGKAATGYPGFLEKECGPSVALCDEPVVRDGTVVTSRGPGTAMDFTLELVEILAGSETRGKVEAALQRPDA